MRMPLVILITFACGSLTALTHAEDRWPSKWGGGPSGYDVVLDTETRLSGDYSVCLSKSPTVTEHKFGTIVQAISAKRFAGKRLRFAGYVKAQDVTSHAGLWLRADSSERGSVAFDNMQSRPITGTQNWYKYEIVLDIPDDAAMINFGALLAGDGAIWIDDLSIEVVTDDVEPTSKSMRPTNQEIAIPTSLSLAPQNLSFDT